MLHFGAVIGVVRIGVPYEERKNSPMYRQTTKKYFQFAIITYTYSTYVVAHEIMYYKLDSITYRLVQIH